MEYSSNRKYKNNYEKDIDQYQQQQNEEFLNSTFNKLYYLLKPGCPRNYTLPQNFQNLLKRILSTNFSIMKNNESAIINGLLEKVSQQYNSDQRVLSKFQQLYSRLTKKQGLTKRWGILYILNALSKNNNEKDMSFSATNELQQNYLNMPMNNNILLEKGCLGTNSFNKFQPNAFDINTSSNINYYNNNLSPISNINERFYENQNLMNYNNSTFPNSKESPIVVNQNKTTLKITEKDIINDLLFVFEGINGKYIAYDSKEDAYILSKLVPWNEDIYNIVNSLSEIGWLYKKIKLYVDYFKDSNIQSQYIKSFVNAVQNELNNYFKLISFFRKLNQNQNVNFVGNEKRSQNLNLKNIILWTLIPKETLKWIASCCEALHSLKGTSVLSQIYSFVHYGGCNEYLNNILNEVSKPFINFLINWIKYGELQDTNKEFFVDILNGIKDEDVWNLQYQLIGKNVPNFMQREPTIKIFEVGKCIHFIRNYCKENYNLSNLKIILINLIQKYSRLNRAKEESNNLNMNINPDDHMELDEGDINVNSIMNINEDQPMKRNNDRNNLDKYSFDFGFDEEKIMFEIESYQSCLDFIEYLFDPSKQKDILNISFINEIIFNIDVIHKLINKDLVRIIFTKFKFLSNLDSINKYLLLGQGDMMQSLMESLFEELNKPANLIFKHNLQSNLESAIRASNAQYNDPECLKKLYIKLINASVGDIGWDIFCLEYKVDLPLSVIFNSKLLKDYQKLFFFFWKIKRIEYSQNNHVWKKIKTFSQFLKNKVDYMKKPIEISIHFNQEIIHFITNLHNYLALEVLETQYKKLINELPKVNNLDELIIKHKKFVDNIKKQCLLGEENNQINKKINNIFDIILRFRTIHDVLYNFLVENSYENSNDISSNNYINQNRHKNIKEYLQQISILYKDFQNQIIELINTINLLGKDNLKFLNVKLDFNYYYSFLEKEEEEKKNLEAIRRINAEEERRKIIEGKISDDDNDNSNNNNYSHISGNKYGNNNTDNDYIGNGKEGVENAGNEEMEIDDNNNINNRNYRFQNLENNDQSLHESNNNSNIINDFDNNNNLEVSNDSHKNNDNNNNANNFDKKNFLENSNNIFGKSSKYYSSKNDNNFNDSNNNLNSDINDSKDMNNISGFRTSKNNNIQIITKRKENKPKENNIDSNNVLDINKYYVNNNVNDNNGEAIDNNLPNNNNNDYKINNYIKTQIVPKTYQYEKNNMQSGLTYDFKSMTKNKPVNNNLENIDDEDKITTDIKPRKYEITTRARSKKNDDNK